MTTHDIDPVTNRCRCCGRSLVEVMRLLNVPEDVQRHTLDEITQHKRSGKPLTP